MGIALPTYPGPKSAEAVLVDAGGWQEPILGGEEIRLDRLGDKFQLSVTMPPMKFHKADGVSAARVWSARLNRGISEGVIMEFPQPDFDLAIYPTEALVAAPVAAQSILVSAVGLGVSYPYFEGQFVTIRQQATGRNFLHQLRSSMTATAGGTGNLSLFPRVRIPLVEGDRILVAAPVIEGRLVEPSALSMEEIRTVGVSFTIKETR